MRLRECQTRRTLLACFSFMILVSSLTAVPEAVHIYGIHSWNDGASGIMNGKTGWTVEVVNTDYFAYDLTVEQAQRIVAEGFTLIIRINKTFGVTVPTNPADYDAFAQACAQKVQTFKSYCHRWIIGNEMNADFEGNIPVANYIQVYGKCRTAIKQVQPEAEVLVAALGPWNASQSGVGPYPSNRQWLNYMYQLVNTLNDACDGYAIHAYGGRSGDTDPRDDNEMGFGVFLKWMEIIDGNAYAFTKPVYLTEMNHAADGNKAPGVPQYDYPAGYISKLFEAINTWNETHSHRISCAAWFAYANGGFPGYNITLNTLMRDDFSATTQTTDYLFVTLAVSPTIWPLFH